MARRRIPIGSLRRTVPPSNAPSEWRTRVGCKRSAPNAPPLKKKKPYRGVAAESNVSESHQGNWSLSGQCGTGQALRCDSSEHSFSPEGEDVNCQNSCSTEHHLSDRGTSHPHDMHPLHVTSDHNFSPNGEDVNRQNSRSTEHHLSEGGASHLHDMHLLHDTSQSNYLAVEGDFHLPDSLKCMTAEELNESKDDVKVEMNLDPQESNKGVTAGNNDVSMSDNGNLGMFGQCGSSEKNFSPGDYLCVQNSVSTECHFSARGASYLLHMHRQHETPESNCYAIGGDLHLPDSRPKFVTAEELNEDEEASDAESQVDRWACRICKVAAVSTVVLPCRHLCLCWDCEEKTENCPVCGQAKRDVFYINC